MREHNLDPDNYKVVYENDSFLEVVSRRGRRRILHKQKIDSRLKIKIKYFDQEIEKIQKISVGDWIDLRSAERVELKAGEYKLLRLGVGMILPDGYEAHVLPRSSTPSKFGIVCANSMGIIDNSYSGDEDEWRFPAIAFRDTVIEKGDRICQFRIIKNQPGIKFEIVDHLNDVSRGGIGSTGKR
jgi:dUTP pyrophosphatase